MKKLTSKQYLILDFLKRKVDPDIASVSLRDICAEFGFKSKNAAFKHLEALEKKGVIKRCGTKKIRILK